MRIAGSYPRVPQLSPADLDGGFAEESDDSAGADFTRLLRHSGGVLPGTGARPAGRDGTVKTGAATVASLAPEVILTWRTNGPPAGPPAL